MRNLWTLWVAVQLAIVAGLWLRRADHTTAVITVPVPYVVHDRGVPVEAPPPPAPPVAATSTCPTAVRAAPAARPDAFPAEQLAHVTTAFTDARWIATWNDDHVFVSKNGGRSFVRVLDGPGKLTAVAFDCFGRVLVMRDQELGIHDRDDQWHDLDWIQSEAVLIGGGPDAIVFAATGTGKARIAISSDLGATWTDHDVTAYLYERRTSGREDPDGTIRIASTYADCMTDPLYWYVIAHGELSTEPEHQANPGPFYLRGDILYTGYEWRRRSDADWRAIRGLPEDNGVTILDGPVARAVASGRIYRLVDGVATAMRSAPDSIELQAVDAAGRMWGLERGELRLVDAHEPPLAGD